MRHRFGCRPKWITKNLWKKFQNPSMHTEVCAEKLIKEFIDNNVNMILVGGCAAIFHGLKEQLNDYDFLIKNCIENNNKIYSICTKYFTINKQFYYSNLSNFLKLKTTTYKIDLIKRCLPSVDYPKGEKRNRHKIAFGLKFSNYGTICHYDYDNLIKKTVKAEIFGNNLDIISKEDYLKRGPVI